MYIYLKVEAMAEYCKEAQSYCPAGPQGPPGNKGSRGDVGLPGSSGMDGREGKPGARGPKGEVGKLIIERTNRLYIQIPPCSLTQDIPATPGLMAVMASQANRAWTVSFFCRI